MIQFKRILIVVNCLICHLFSWLYREFSTRSLMRLVKKIKTWAKDTKVPTSKKDLLAIMPEDLHEVERPWSHLLPCLRGWVSEPTARSTKRSRDVTSYSYLGEDEEEEEEEEEEKNKINRRIKTRTQQQQQEKKII